MNITPTLLYRTQPEKNMFRFYSLEIKRDLFGAFCVVREWGRIGAKSRQRRTVPYPTLEEANHVLDKLYRGKISKIHPSHQPSLFGSADMVFFRWEANNLMKRLPT